DRLNEQVDIALGVDFSEAIERTLPKLWEGSRQVASTKDRVPAEGVVYPRDCHSGVRKIDHQLLEERSVRERNLDTGALAQTAGRVVAALEYQLAELAQPGRPHQRQIRGSRDHPQVDGVPGPVIAALPGSVRRLLEQRDPEAPFSRHMCVADRQVEGRV